MLALVAYSRKQLGQTFRPIQMDATLLANNIVGGCWHLLRPFAWAFKLSYLLTRWALPLFGHFNELIGCTRYNFKLTHGGVRMTIGAAHLPFLETFTLQGATTFGFSSYHLALGIREGTLDHLAHYSG